MKRLVLENLGWKAASLVLAVLLWMGIVGNPEATASFSVPIQLQNMPPELDVSSDIPERVQLQVRGPRGRLRMHSLAETVVIINLEGARAAGVRTFPIESGNAALPSGVRLERAQPPQVRLTLERRLSREIPVHVRVGAPPSGYSLVSAEARPGTLRVSGPESRVREVTAAETDPIDLSEVTGETEIPTHAYVDDPRLHFDSGSRVIVEAVVRKTN